VKGSHHDETQALASHASKGKGRGRGFNKPFKGGKSRPTPEHKKKDLSRIQYFECENFGHYARHCPLWKKGKAPLMLTESHPRIKESKQGH
jgi:hypothetical protein